MDSRGNLCLADVGASRIRVILATLPSAAALPRALSFQAASGGAATDAQLVNVSSSLAGLVFMAKADQPWLTVTAGVVSSPSNIQVSADPTGLDPGTYTGTVTIAPPGSTAPLASILVSFSVVAPLPPKLGLDTQGLTFSATSGGELQTRSFRVQNTGGGALDFSIAVSGSGSAAILVDTRSGSAQPTSSVPVIVTLDPKALPVGIYQATVTVASRGTGETVTIPVTTVSRRGPSV